MLRRGRVGTLQREHGCIWVSSVVGMQKPAEDKSRAVSANLYPLLFQGMIFIGDYLSVSPGECPCMLLTGLFYPGAAFVNGSSKRGKQHL